MDHDIDRARIISVVVAQDEAGLFHATSPEMGELLVTGRSLEDVRSTIPAVIAAICEAHGSHVDVRAAEDLRQPGYEPWVIVPERQCCSA